MSETQFDFGTILRLIHVAITRAIDVEMDRSQSFAQNGYPDASTQAGFAAYLRTTTLVIQGHHLAEDRVAFPYFRDRVIEAPFDQFAAQHIQIAPILEEIDQSIDQGGGPTEVRTAVRRLRLALARLRGIWRLHVQAEQDFLNPTRLEETLNTVQQAEIVQSFLEYSLQHSGPLPLAVSFLLFNLDSEARALLARALPPGTVAMPLPTAWKEQWAPMMPFLMLEEERAGQGGPVTEKGAGQG